MRLFTENITASISRRQRPSIYSETLKSSETTTTTTTTTTTNNKQAQQLSRTPFKNISRNSSSTSPTQSTHSNNINNNNNPLNLASSAASSYSASFPHNPSFLTIPHSQATPHHHPNPSSVRSESVPRKSSACSSTRSTIENEPSRSHGRHTPLPGFRSASALSQISFRSLRSINSRIKVRIQSLGQSLEARKPKLPELDWSALRAEYELHLARGSIIERCLVQVDLGPSVTERGRWWIDTVWTLADKLSPPLPAALAQYSASGLIPLLTPLRHTLHRLAVELPYNHLEDTPDLDKFEELGRILRRAIWLAGLIENVIELVSQVGLVRFELAGLRRPFEDLKLNDDDELKFDDSLQLDQLLDRSIRLISHWSGEIRGRTGSNNPWKGSIKLS
ncbi:hypothetical protein PGT21_029436 [Puccinia graminis f. sp. tritici]|uniref:Uncharacterized protein n=1 Tax=Puccinia graminis f. sp. tritici TaxID=56615 RepID=A0A5B0M7H7_PUCGR|nr:hypothetical protein PGT21_029436 [Puccinia graminis f. sp. tritici]KAA1135279.1 hypothetical protein PGTUg99_024786 [Puccinia graminis f. sp. tritici]